MSDAIKVLSEAKEIKPAWNTRLACWNYDIEGRDHDGNELTIRVAPTDDLKGVVLVTGF